ncbi:type II toxin-antitoxin system Phd/YefM family antitoxin [Rhodohalobacter sp.]|uniref:type II toxin-antitoxin system Phd/YefM family antitoxin n=1 Tax=Rhodohalobacter sp. TaxID=1974210 RepID=UPI002ACDB9E8|nr:type II toxin-antitoxin system Phd/YefM family antitoxin [Rhodohalobacter sp.]MDZ7755927.1 type II toxin-antitoxin system Phd/YefM family antitoxin [Rhodohalobacter sp.]MDZ7757175.1 type II toxin-antitoxin system Phd/YefM family antitoxin [Rhodohalobacter sp.]
MSKIQLEENFCSLSDFQGDVASYIKKLKEDRRPLVITKQGRNSAVLLDSDEYRKLVDKAQLLEEIVAARKELKSGEGIDHDEFIRTLRSQYAS